MRTTHGCCALIAVLLAACSPATRTARTQASADFGCERGALTITKRSQDTYLVRGCDRTGVYQCPEAPGVSSRFCVNLALMARNRGERGLRCEFEQVGVEEISPFVFRAEGCGREAIYHCEASDGRPRCLIEREAGASTEPSAPEPSAAADPTAP